MIKGMARLTTGGDVAKIAIAILLGAGVGSIVAAAMQAGAGRVCIIAVIGAATIGVVAHSGLGILQRYRQLRNGKCPNPICHGVVQRSELVGKGTVVCPTCKKKWPELESMAFRATART